MLSLANIEAGTYLLKPEKVSLSESVGQVIALLLPNVEAKKQILRFDALETSSDVWADKQALSHIVTNFIENAIKYTPEEGQIEISIAIKEDRTSLFVDDSGDGIKPKHRKRIFERFFRIDKGRTRKEGGSGLGLSIVRNLAAKMEAQVGVRKSDLGGAQFWCSLPNCKDVEDELSL